MGEKKAAVLAKSNEEDLIGTVVWARRGKVGQFPLFLFFLQDISNHRSSSRLGWMVVGRRSLCILELG